MAALLLAGLVSACAPSPATTPAPQSPASDPAGQAPEAPAAEAPDSGEHAFGTTRDQLATAIEAAFSGDNGTARWEGDTLVLAIDGDATTTMAGFTQCRVLSHLLLEDEPSIIEFPNGQVACADVLDTN